MAVVRRWRPMLAAAMAGSLAVVLAACGSSDDSASANGTSKFTLAVTDPSMGMTNAVYTSIPIQKGYWKDLGLDVTTQPVADSTVGAQSVSSGQIEGEIGGVATMYIALEKDPSMRLIGFTGSIYEIVAFAGDGISSISDLRGKSIGVSSLSSAAYLVGRSMVEAGGLDPDKDVEWVPVGVGGQAAAAYENGTVQAFSEWNSAHAAIAGLLDKELEVLPSDLLKTPAMHAFLVNGDVSEDDRIAFLQGVFQSAAWASANLEEAVRLHWKEFPAQAPKPGDEEAAMAEGVQVLEAALERYLPNGQAPKATVDDVQATADLLHSVGILPGQTDVSKVVDLESGDKAGEFDVSKFTN